MTAYKRSAVIGCLVAIHAAAASAGTVTIVPGPTSASIVLTATNATTDEILDTLAGRTAFDLERIGDLALARTITHTYTGTPRQIVDQLLNNVNYFVLTSVPSGTINRVVLYARHNGTPLANPPAPTAPAAFPAAAPPASVAVSARRIAAAPIARSAAPVPAREAATPSRRRTIITPTSLANLNRN